MDLNTTSIVIAVGGLLVGLILFLTSNSDRKKINQRKRELDNYKSIIDQANDAMLVIDLVNGKIHQANPSAAALLGYSEEELTKRTLFDLHPQEYLQKSSSVVADVWEKGGLIFNDIPFLNSSGQLVPVECSAKVAPFAGRPAIVIYARDIRERLELEQKINSQRKLIDEKNKDITDSIEYSKRIQRSILQEKDRMKMFASESFIFFQPRDVVSGDFYWFVNYQLNNDVQSETGNVFKKGSRILVVAAVDCTGHGVPGAFMSIIGNTLLDQTVRKADIRSPAKALDYVNENLKNSLNRNKEDTPLRDGMDISLCSIDMDGLLLEFAGANNPLYVVRNKEMIVLKADKQPITASPDLEAKHFTNQVLKLEKNDCIYLFTDGFADQFGGERGKKFMYKQFKELLIDISSLNMEEQKLKLKSSLQNWMGGTGQVDDILVIGVKIV
jgi:PAS domain S-box-containing protein